VSQSKKKAGRTASSTSTMPGILSAGVVIVVLALLGLLLMGRSGAEPATSPDGSATLQPENATSGAAQLTEEEIDAEAAAAEAIAAADEADTEAEAEAIQPLTYDSPPAMAIDPEQDYTATITTPRGDIVIRLRPDIAPQTVNSFIFLAREGFYDGLTWHRVLPNFMAQGGDPEGTGMGGPGYNVPAEFTNEILFDRPGIVAMARRGDDINSAGSQFFITTAPYPTLNNQYTIFGEVIEGQDIVDNIPLRDPMTATEPGEEIISITIEEG
jgi:peptidylprolyl isomerase